MHGLESKQSLIQSPSPQNHQLALLYVQSKVSADFSTQGMQVIIHIQWNLSIAVTIAAKFFGCYRQVAALMR